MLLSDKFNHDKVGYAVFTDSNRFVKELPRRGLRYWQCRTRTAVVAKCKNLEQTSGK